MNFKDLFQLTKIKVMVSSVFIIWTIFFFNTMKFGESNPMTCFLIFFGRINCAFAEILMWISLIVLVLSIVYLVIGLIIYIKSKKEVPK